MIRGTSRLLLTIGLGLGGFMVTDGAMMREARAVEGLLTDLRPEIGTLVHSYYYRTGYSAPRTCTATLITPDFVLTAAHCVDYSPDYPEEYSFLIFGVDVFRYQVAEIFSFGEIRHWANNKVPSDDDLMAVSRHPTPTGRGNDDVALLQLAASVPADVAMPSGVATWYPDVGETVTVFGYGGRCRLGNVGKTDPPGVKRYASWIYQVNNSDPTNPQRNQPTGLICEGDSGGPAVDGGPDEDGPIWGVASSSSSEWDWYGDVIYYRPRMEYIVTGRPEAEYRKDLVDVPLSDITVNSELSILGPP